jgi:arsenate-mycothiol transferase
MAEISTASELFVCVKNGGKSQMAAGLMRKTAGDALQVYSAGTKPGNAINELSAQALAEVGVDIRNETPKPIDPELVRDVVILGREAHVDPVAGTEFENWDIDETAVRCIGFKR